MRGPDVTEAVVAGILGLLSVGNDPIPLRYDHQEFASEKALKDWCAEKVRTGNANWLVWHVDSMSLNTLNKLMIKLRPQLARVDSAETLGGWGLGRMSANRPYTPREQITHNAHAVSVIKKLVRGNPRAALSQIQFLFEKEAKKDAKLKASYIPELSHSTWKGIAQDLGITFHLHQKTFYQLPGDPALGVAFARRVLRETKAPEFCTALTLCWCRSPRAVSLGSSLAPPMASRWAELVVASARLPVVVSAIWSAHGSETRSAPERNGRGCC